MPSGRALGRGTQDDVLFERGLLEVANDPAIASRESVDYVLLVTC